jgi:tRNA-splicing ligase RtcB (3'-phosphate/5'-hydroxy nucleic acid ligase)
VTNEILPAGEATTGRRLSRSKARKTLDLDGFVASMAGRSWQQDHAAELIDEDPRAYKDIDQVMADQQDLVRIEHTLHQILNYKGVEGGPRRRKGR